MKTTVSMYSCIFTTPPDTILMATTLHKFWGFCHGLVPMKIMHWIKNCRKMIPRTENTMKDPMRNST
jgi:hypothetical protein